MTYTLFLDDVRDPPPKLPNPCVVRTLAEAKERVQLHGVPTIMSLDHDLGAQETGMQFLHWLIERYLDHELDLQQVQQVIVHSANPVGAANLRALWDGFAKHIGSAVRAELRPSLM